MTRKLEIDFSRHYKEAVELIETSPLIPDEKREAYLGLLMGSAVSSDDVIMAFSPQGSDNYISANRRRQRDIEITEALKLCM